MHQGRLCDPLSVVALWSGSCSACDGTLLREGLFVELEPQAGSPYTQTAGSSARTPKSHSHTCTYPPAHKTHSGRKKKTNLISHPYSTENSTSISSLKCERGAGFIRSNVANPESWVQLCSSRFCSNSAAVCWPRWLE